MKNKKLLALLAALSLSLSFAGCQKAISEENSSATSQKESVKEDNTNDDKDKTSDKEDVDSDDSSEKQEEASIYTYDIDSDKLVENTVKLDKVTPENLFAELQKLDVISKDAKLNSYDISEADGIPTGFLDVSSEFVNSNLGSSAESLMLDAVVKTMIENTDAEQILLTVDGGDYESGHIHLGAGDFLTVKDGDDSSDDATSSDEQSDEADTVE